MARVSSYGSGDDGCDCGSQQNGASKPDAGSHTHSALEPYAAPNRRAIVGAEPDEGLGGVSPAARAEDHAATPTGIGPKIAWASAAELYDSCPETYPEGNPGGYCGLGGTGVSCPVGLARVAPDN